MHEDQVTAVIPAHLHEIAALLPRWDASRPSSELITALRECLSRQARTGAKKSGKSMSRRRGQRGTTIEKHGAHYTVRARVDAEGEEKRIHARIKISPIKKGNPGWLNSAERQRRALEIVADSGANSEARFNASVGPSSSGHKTFAQQAKILLQEARDRNEPAARSTLNLWDSCLRNWLLPMLGDVPLNLITNTDLKELVAWMKKGGPLPTRKE